MTRPTPTRIGVDRAVKTSVWRTEVQNAGSFHAPPVPGLTQVSVLVSITQLIASFQVFGQVYIMTRGGPGDATRVLIQHIYEAGFRDLQLGYAAAVSLFLFTVMAVVSAVQFTLVSREA